VRTESKLTLPKSGLHLAKVKGKLALSKLGLHLAKTKDKLSLLKLSCASDKSQGASPTLAMLLWLKSFT
jgi:hypothetical protein